MTTGIGFYLSFYWISSKCFCIPVISPTRRTNFNSLILTNYSHHMVIFALFFLPESQVKVLCTFSSPASNTHGPSEVPSTRYYCYRPLHASSEYWRIAKAGNSDCLFGSRSVGGTPFTPHTHVSSRSRSSDIKLHVTESWPRFRVTFPRIKE